MHSLSVVVTVVQVGECVLNDLGTFVVVVVVVAVVVWLYADIHHGVHFILICIVEGSCPGMFIIQLLRPYALEC